MYYMFFIILFSYGIVISSSASAEAKAEASSSSSSASASAEASSSSSNRNHDTDQQNQTCPEGFTFFSNENKCLKAFSTPKTFNNAMKSCKELNSHLVFVRDEATNTLLRQIVDSIQASCTNRWVDFPAFWTGGRKPCPSKTKWNWVPTKGTHLDMPYTNWRQGQPNNHYGIENCIHFLLDENLDWNDTRCELPFCFVCEVDM